MRWNTVIALGAALATTGATACRSCTLLGCEDGAAFTLWERSDAWATEQDAHYRFTVTFDGKEHVCEGIVADGLTCASDAIDVQRFGSGSEDDAIYGIDGIEVYSYPGPTRLKVERDDVVVLEEDFDIQAVIEHPNGPGCGTCEYWRADVTW